MRTEKMMELMDQAFVKYCTQLEVFDWNLFGFCYFLLLHIMGLFCTLVGIHA